MRYLFAFLIPPLAVFLCKRTAQGVVNLIVWLVSIPAIAFLGLGLIGWLLCTAHALAVCRASSIDKRLDRMARAVEAQSHSETTSEIR